MEDGRARFAERHVARLVEAARSLGLGELDAGRVRGALAELARAAFGSGSGVVRLQASRDGEGRLHLVGVPRALGPEPRVWSAIALRVPHEGGGLAPGIKVASRLTLALAADAARRAGVDEVLVVDAGGRLVEGARSNAFVALASGTLATPPLARGAVAGIARGVALERVAGIAEREIGEAELREAREIVAVNAVRGARPIVRLDGVPVGAGDPGPWAQRLADALAAD